MEVEDSLYTVLSNILWLNQKAYLITKIFCNVATVENLTP